MDEYQYDDLSNGVAKLSLNCRREDLVYLYHWKPDFNKISIDLMRSTYLSRDARNALNQALLVISPFVDGNKFDIRNLCDLLQRTTSTAINRKHRN
jgi:hypothetical protein